MKKNRQEELAARFERLGVKTDDLEEKFIIGSGSGGQNLQKTSSCVWLKHIPSGIEIKCQKTRMREENRLLARELLCETLEKERQKKEQEKKAAEAKKRREKRKRSAAQKEKIVTQKRAVSKKKMHRKAPSSEE